MNMANKTGIISKLRMAQISSCSCLTKTPEVSWHDATCRYRVLAEAIEVLANHSEEPLGVVEPVAEVQHGPFDDVGAPQWVRVVTLGDFDLEHFPDGTKFFTSPPAPVAVPDDLAQNAKRYEWIRSPNIGHCEISRVLFETISDDCNPPYRSLKCGKDLDAAIDACLDKVKELNQ